MAPFGKMLILFGIVLVGVGVFVTLFDKTPFLGKLPGDIHVKRDNFQFYFPLTTSIVVSLLLSAILWFVGKK